MTDSKIDLRTIREGLGESQEAFALRFGVDQSTIARWETRGVPRRGAARALIERLSEEIGPKQAVAEAV